MLQRIFLIVAILAGIGVIVVSQTKLKEHIQGIIEVREKNINGWTNEIRHAKNLSDTLKTTSNNLVAVTAELITTSNSLVSANANLETAKSERDKALADLEKAKDAVKAGEQELAQWRNLGIKPEQVKATIADLAKAKDAIVAMDQENKVLDKKYKTAQAELDRILGGADFWVKLPDGLKGKVLVVDPKWEFAVLDVGENQGVLKGGIMVIHRDSKLVGKIRVSTVMPDRCVANIMPGWSLGEIREGDQALYLPK